MQRRNVRARGLELRWGERTYVMGIINVTPDSFSGDGIAPEGRAADEVVQAAVTQAERFVAAGAQILDVGAESSRPAAVYGAHPPVGADAEAERAVPVVAELARRFTGRALVSIDTSKGVVAQAALEAGATIVNDVWAASRDPGTAEAAARHGAHLVLMHNKDRAEYPDGLMAEIVAHLSAALERAAALGVPSDRLIVDPGIGFGKSPAQSIEVLHRLAELKVLATPILVGTSRKRFIGEILGGVPADQRLEGTAASVALAIAAGADAVRVHDVAALMRTVRVADAIIRHRSQLG
ncbi:MAG: dihydropteroate synthase [Chloroflexota bacterium]|nr:dihydropteroate synthase [Chloroflexota bacterium]